MVPQLTHALIGALMVLALLAFINFWKPTVHEADEAASTAKGAAVTHPKGVPTRRVITFSGRPFGLDISSQGLAFVTQQDANAVAGFDLSDPTQPITPIGVTADPGDVIFDSTGSTAYVSTFFGGKVHVIDTKSGTVSDTIDVGGNAYRLAIAKDDSRLYVTSVYGDVRAVKLKRGFPITAVNLGSSLQGIALSPDGKALYVASTSGSVWRLDPMTLKVQATAHVGHTPQELLIAPDGTELYVAGEQGALVVVNASTLEVCAAIPLVYGLFGMALSPDGEQLYVASTANGTLNIVDRATRTVLNTLTLGGQPRRISFDATGTVALVANEGNWVDVIT